MRKIYKTPDFVNKQSRKLRRFKRKTTNKKKRKIFSSPVPIKNNGNAQNFLPIEAPEDLRLIENTEECLLFFRNLRNATPLIHENGYKKLVAMSLVNVKYIDYAAISILIAICENFRFRDIILKGNFPNNQSCKQFLVDSGFLDLMFNLDGKRFPKSEYSEYIFFEKGSGKFTLDDNIKISRTVKKVVNHLTNESFQCLPVKSIILEICGNSIEWGKTENKQWILGVKYEDEKVTFTVTDIGKGIIETLYIKYLYKIQDFLFYSRDEILFKAFEQKYGSTTKEINRNKGLPAVKNCFDMKIIKDLKVITNNVMLHFDNNKKSRTFRKGDPRFKGTFYQWEMTKEGIYRAKGILNDEKHERN